MWDVGHLWLDYARLREEFKREVEVKNRKYMLRTYKNCFVGAKAVLWLISSGWARNSAEAVEIGCILQRRLVSKPLRRSTNPGEGESSIM